MRRRLVTLATAVMVALAIAVPAGAADLHSAHEGTTCEGGFVLLHFVNNQTGGVSANLTATFSNGDVVVVAPDESNSNNNHYTISRPANTTLVTASTDGPGKLVLSNFECGDAKKKG